MANIQQNVFYKNISHLQIYWQGYKTIFMLNLSEHEIITAQLLIKTKML